MLAALRHGAVVGGDGEQGVLPGGDPGHHIVDEAVVSRNIHKAQHRAAAAGGIGKAQIDGQSPAALFAERIGFHPGHRPHQARLAVVDMPREGDDHAGRMAKGMSKLRHRGEQSIEVRDSPHVEP